MAQALLIVPPMLKYAAGPLLGPALLTGAARNAGHSARVVDLNIRFLMRHLGDRRDDDDVRAYGDHARPPQGLDVGAQRFFDLVADAIGGPAGRRSRNTALTLPVSHARVYAAAANLARAELGRWTEEALRAGEHRSPSLVGVSVLYSGQVLAGLVVTLVARALWPGVPVVWGGPHVTALRDVIPHDEDFGRWIDGFSFGAAESTFVELLDAIDQGTPWPPEVVKAGSGRLLAARSRPGVMPEFDDLPHYGVPVLTLPTQTGRGCAYGRCSYCTYPAIEGKLTDLGLAMLEHVVREAEAHRAVVSLKDSLLLPRRLEEIAECVAGRVTWAGCTKLHRRLDCELLSRLALSGCRTLEFGLETLLPVSQRLIGKRQSKELLARVLDACAQADVHPVVNLITGFPGEDRAAAARMRAEVEGALLAAGGPGFGQVEHNTFELERLAPMAKDPRIEVTASWPWASVMDWRWRGEGS